ncbi:MAG: YfiR family protein [Acidobacteriota bacterium]|nr:YfiR family protein [Acidobacteriota bacterium]
MIPFCRRLILWALFCLCPLVYGQDGNAPRPAYDIKADWLVNFIRFVDWPDNVFPEDHITLMVLGKEPNADRFGGRDLMVRGRKIIITYRTQITPDDLKDCHLLFITRPRRKDASRVLQLVGTRPILTVSETAGFLTEGGVINFVRKEESILFEISQKNAGKSGLRIASRLLSRAEFVEKADNGRR